MKYPAFDHPGAFDMLAWTPYQSPNVKVLAATDCALEEKNLKEETAGQPMSATNLTENGKAYKLYVTTNGAGTWTQYFYSYLSQPETKGCLEIQLPLLVPSCSRTFEFATDPAKSTADCEAFQTKTMAALTAEIAGTFKQ